MNSINIENIDLNDSFFHFTLKDNLNSIEENGLVAQVGDASELVGDKPRVCLSRGVKGILGIKNSFIYKFKGLRICDIPEGYKKYFSISDFTSTEHLDPEMIYDAMEKRFRDEVYLKVDAKEGEDFLPEESFGLSSKFDIKGKENHNIDETKLSILTSPKGNSAMDVVQYLYSRLLENNPGKENIIREMNSELVGMLEYINDKNKVSIKSVVSKAIKDGVNLEDIAYADRANTRDKNMEDFTKDE